MSDVDSDLDSLREPFRKHAYRLVETLAAEGLPFRVFETERTFLRSHRLFLQGRTLRADGSVVITDSSKIVTKARAGESPHNWGLALDCVLVPKDHAWWADDGPAKGAWDTGYDGGKLVRPHVKLAWERYGRAVRAMGLTWGGDFVSFKDFPHAELVGWRTLRPATWKEVVARELERSAR